MIELPKWSRCCDHTVSLSCLCISNMVKTMVAAKVELSPLMRKVDDSVNAAKVPTKEHKLGIRVESGSLQHTP